MDNLNMLSVLGAEEHKALGDRLAIVMDRLDKAASRAGRNRDEIAVVAVSKKHGPEKIQAVVEYWRKFGGNPCFGESYIQEALSKQDILAGLVPVPANWHFIGHLQSNKAKMAAGRFGLIHTLDSLSLAQNLQKTLRGLRQDAAARAPVQPVLIQVNLGEEAQKSGIRPGELDDFVEKLQCVGLIAVQGLMCVPPYSGNGEASRAYFSALRQMRDGLERRLGKKLPHLSMGMSHDFEQAIEEGATFVRIGTDIFGPRA